MKPFLGRIIFYWVKWAKTEFTKGHSLKAVLSKKQRHSTIVLCQKLRYSGAYLVPPKLLFSDYTPLILQKQKLGSGRKQLFGKAT